MLSTESTNYIYGSSNNAYTDKRTSGGSSGGNGTIVRLGLTNVSIGTDIGGSVRIPCSYNGIVGLKPTSGRLKSQIVESFCARSYDNQSLEIKPTLIMSSFGPMTRSVEDCQKIFKFFTNLPAPDIQSPT